MEDIFGESVSIPEEQDNSIHLSPNMEFQNKKPIHRKVDSPVQQSERSESKQIKSDSSMLRESRSMGTIAKNLSDVMDSDTSVIEEGNSIPDFCLVE